MVIASHGLNKAGIRERADFMTTHFLVETLIDDEPESDVTENRCYSYVKHAQAHLDRLISWSMRDWHYSDLTKADIADLEDEHRYAASKINAWDGTGESVEYEITGPNGVTDTFRISKGECVCS